MKLCGINGSVLRRLNLGVWFVQMATPTTQETLVRSAKGDSRCTQRITSLRFSAGYPSKWFRVSGSARITVVLAAPVDIEPLPLTMAAPLPPNTVENMSGPAPVDSVGFTLKSGGGMLERSDVIIRADDVTICDAARGELRRSGVTVAIAAWPPDVRTSLSRVAGTADDDDLRTLRVHVGPRGTRVRCFADALDSMREDHLLELLVQGQGLRTGCFWNLLVGVPLGGSTSLVATNSQCYQQ